MQIRYLTAAEFFGLSSGHAECSHGAETLVAWGIDLQGRHLAHGSPRFSEDLVLLVGSSLNLDAIAKSTCKGLPVLPGSPT
jgi:hypothetical protein